MRRGRDVELSFRSSKRISKQPTGERRRRQEQHPPPTVVAEEEMGLGSLWRRCLELVCVVLLPPLGVYLRHGCYTMGFWISVLITILGYLLFFLEARFYMGYALCVVYAVWVLVHVYRHGLPDNGDGDDDDDNDDEFAGATANLSYVFVA